MVQNSFSLKAIPAWLFLIQVSLAQLTSIYYCPLVTQVFAFCEAKTPEITDLPRTSAASCICTSQIGSLTWGPSLFDQAVAKCISQFSGNQLASGILSDVSLFEGFCSTYYHPETGVQPSATLASTAVITSESQALTSSPTPSSPIPSQPLSAAASGSAIATPTANPNNATKVNARVLLLTITVLVLVMSPFG